MYGHAISCIIASNTYITSFHFGELEREREVEREVEKKELKKQIKYIYVLTLYVYVNKKTLNTLIAKCKFISISKGRFQASQKQFFIGQSYDFTMNNCII